MKLAIISHTEHYKDASGNIVGWGPTISEINYLSNHFDTIYHIAFLHEDTPPPSSLPYTSKNVVFLPLPPSGGASLLKKLTLLTNLPKTLKIIKATLKEVDAFQFRAPTGIGVFVIPWLTKRTHKKGWFKYAGNWNQENPPLGYKLQRRLLKNQPRIVTINGAWKDQPAHCLTFENPCLLEEEREEGLEVISNKKYTAPFSLCFVGRLEDPKGVQRIIDALANLPDRTQLKHMHFIGDGAKFHHYKEQCAALQLPTTFHGFLNRKEVFDVYRNCQFLLLPSTASEGFPKVIAEAMNFGCIPIISNVSSITQYVTKSNGFVVAPTTSSRLLEVLQGAFATHEAALKEQAVLGHATAKNFTFEHYTRRILEEILQKE